MLEKLIKESENDEDLAAFLSAYIDVLYDDIDEENDEDVKPVSKSKKKTTNKKEKVETVSKELGSSVSANIAVLGVVNEICSIVKHEYLLDVIIDNFPARAAENNKKAYNIGIELAKKALGE